MINITCPGHWCIHIVHSTDEWYIAQSVREDVMTIEPVGFQLIHPAVERLHRLSLQVVNKLLRVDIDTATLVLGGDDGQTNVYTAVLLTTRNITRTLGIDRSVYPCLIRNISATTHTYNNIITIIKYIFMENMN